MIAAPAPGRTFRESQGGRCLAHRHVERSAEPLFWQELARAVDYRDAYTANHAKRVTDYALLLADALRLSARERCVLKIGALLHDVGKVAIPESILCKPEPLTPSEIDLVRAHPVTGCIMLQSIPALAAVLPIVRSHHERWDGRGYPDGLAGAAIPRLARLVAIADTFDAMTSDRPYRLALAVENALDQIAGGAGTQFDPELADAFVRLGGVTQA
jgi:putative nucleotidyltransferase with HDIG domain